MILYDNSEEMNVSIPVPGVEDCTGLRVRIRATNSAGTSEFSEIPLPGEYQYFSFRRRNVGCKISSIAGMQ